MDTAHGRLEGALDAATIERAIAYIRANGIEAWKQMMESQADRGSRPRPTCGFGPSGPATSSSASASCSPSSPAMVASVLGQFATVDDRLELLAAHTTPTLVIVGRAGQPVRRAVRAHGRRHPGGEPRGDPRRRALATVRVPRRVVAGAERVPRSCASRRQRHERDRHSASLRRAALEVLRGYGVDAMFTLNGGHVWPLYDAAVKQDVRIVDIRHEQTATFAAEGWAKLTRRPGSPCSPPGRASPTASRRDHHGVLQRLAARRARRAGAAGALGRGVAAGARPRADRRVDHEVGRARCTDADDSRASRSTTRSRTALTPHRGPVFLDFPLDVSSARRRRPAPTARCRRGVEPDPDDVERAGGADRRRPSGRRSSSAATCTGRARGPRSRAAVETLRVPCSFNGLGRGCLPADHELAFPRTRGLLKTDADLVVVVGTPLDFRLGFGRFGDAPGRARRRRRRRSGPRTSTCRRRRPATSPRSSTRWPTTAATASTTSPGSRSVRDAEDAPPRRDERAARGRRRPDQADPHLRRAAASGSRATRS